VRQRDDTGTVTPCIGTTVRLFLAGDFPRGQSLAVRTTNRSGGYTFGKLDAPADFMVAIYSSENSFQSLDSHFAQSVPSTKVKVQDFLLENPRCGSTP
jgi:hypothetical protein